MNASSFRSRFGVHGSARRFFLILLCVVAAAFTPSSPLRAQESGEQPLIINPDVLKFVTLPGFPSCFTSAALRGDATKGPSVQLQKFSAGCRVPWHWHTPNEHVTVVSGTFRLEMKDAKTPLMRPGAYAFMPAHHIHQGSCSNPCMLFVSADGVFDIHYVDEAGKEISADEALKGLKTSRKQPKKQ